MLIYAESNPNFNTYGTLNRGDLLLHVILADTEEEFYLEGVKPTSTILEIQKQIQKENFIHQSRQRLFIGGEEMSVASCLLDYFPTAYHAQSRGVPTLVLRCFVPILLSTLHCPGPMLTEIETRPRNDEPVINVKRRIRDKFCIETAKQRLHVHPSEMTSRFLQRPLDDARLLSSYLSPGRGGNFLEVIVVERAEQSRFNAIEKELYLRVPYEVTTTLGRPEANVLQYSSVLHCATPTADDAQQVQPYLAADGLPPPPPPQTPESDLNREGTSTAPTPLGAFSSAQPRFELWWVTLPIQIEKIIKRDPKVEDFLKIVFQVLKDKGLFSEKILGPNFESKNIHNSFLKYCDAKISRGGNCFKPMELIYKNLLVRREEMQMFIHSKHSPVNLNNIPMLFYGSHYQSSDCAPVVQPLKPIEPLEAYSSKLVSFTCPPDSVKMKWDIKPQSIIDCGASPEIDVEITGLSYTRKYGSWDIPKHEKTYVEIILEGSFNVGDLGYMALVDLYSSKQISTNSTEKTFKNKTNKNDFENFKEEIVYYVQNKMELIIYGPFSPNSRRRSVPLSLNKPFGDSAKTFVAERKKNFEFQQEVRRGELKNPPMPRPAPFYMRFDERFINKTAQISNRVDPSWEEQRQLSKNVIGQWCLSRERVSDVAVTLNQQQATATSSKLYMTQCDRGIGKDDRPFVKVVYERRTPISSHPNHIFPKSQHLDSVRNSFDFRVQAQFHISQLLEDKIDLGDKADFKIAVRHWVTRVEHFAHTPDKCVQFESPSKGMDTTFKVDIASESWLETVGEKPLPTLELQQLSS